MLALTAHPDDSLKQQIKAAEHFCAGMARREAKNFYWGFITLPRPKRMAIYALYDFARQVDDEADRPAAERDPTRLAWHRERLHDCCSGTYTDPIMILLGQAIDRYEIPPAEIEHVIDGVEMDLHHDRYASWPELAQYCSLVASAVGRLCVRVFGFRRPGVLRLADDLGLAMQLTNILRDIREDYFQFGRIYLPLDELEDFEIGEAQLVEMLTLIDKRPVPDRRAWDAFVRFQAGRARQLFQSGLRVTDEIPWASATCVLTMAGIYQRLLTQLERDPSLPLTRRISLSNSEKLGVAARSWLRIG